MQQAQDATRRTQLANERTLLAWWRTGMTALAVALGVGRILPELSGGPAWPYAILGAGYGVFGVVLIAYGTHRQRMVEEAVAQERFSSVEPRFVRALTIGAVVLGLATIGLVVVGP